LHVDFHFGPRVLRALPWIDSGKHPFSDVISGTLIGMVIAHRVVQNHKNREVRVLGMEVVPFVDPDNCAAGVALVKSW
jgi:hypothetical protein